MNDSNEGSQNLIVYGGLALAIICILIALTVS
ncbi:MAG: hypothetical protein QOG94_516 [Solirubrobacteraceae bacterium]|jgi:hypothetical protein|nr:hypothetical protein [Solirubrobacteraceae bacterium]